MRPFSFIHIPHFRHFSPHSAAVSVRDKLSANCVEVTMTLAILIGLLIALTFWAAVAR